ncbi:protein sll1483-like isoform X2 [Littorina saxatilis]|uniref:FAS1 domain-containing protein n=2 Tax=Littorina saxatilis TaxID=31220 RepID=A0AAN9GCT5_9CAEN
MKTVLMIGALIATLSSVVGGLAVVRNVYAEADFRGCDKFLSFVDKAGLTKTLKDPRENLTVFAPTDVAIAQLGSDVVKSLETNATFLKQLVSFHVAKGLQLVSVTGVFSTMAATVARVDVYTAPNVTTISGSEVLLADNAASNGMVHVLKRVMYPLPAGTALTYSSGNSFSMLFLALTKAGVTSLLKAPDLTLFAPTDHAFQRLPAGEFSELLGDIPRLTKVLQNHLVSGVVFSAYLKAKGGDILKTQNGHTLNVTVAGNGAILQVEGATVTSADINVNNGVVHVIDTVLMPSVSYRRYQDNEKPSFRVV